MYDGLSGFVLFPSYEKQGTRKVRRMQFEKVFNVWPQYKSGKLKLLKRFQLGFTQNSVYVIGILHFVENLPAKGMRTGSVLGLS